MQRRTLLLSLPALGLAACGGGGDDAEDAPPSGRYGVVGRLAVSQHATARAADGRVVVLGGDRGGNVLSERIDRYDPASGRIEAVGALATGRAGHTATTLADGRILVVGGQTGLPIGALTELVDPTTGVAHEGGWLNATRDGHTATRLADGRVLVCGGLGRDSAELWDPARPGWRLLDARLQHARMGHSATLLADGRVLVAGGHGDGRPYVFAELFDPAIERFEPLAAEGAVPRAAHAAWRGRDGQVRLLGGEAADRHESLPLASTLAFDPATRRFTAAAPLAGPRTMAAAVVPSGERALLFGGLATADAATGAAGAWTDGGGERAIAALPGPRFLHTADVLPDGRVLVLGGEDGRGGFADSVLVWDPRA